MTDEERGHFTIGLVIGAVVVWMWWTMWAHTHIDNVKQIDAFRAEKIADGLRLYQESIEGRKKE